MVIGACDLRLFLSPVFITFSSAKAGILRNEFPKRSPVPVPETGGNRGEMSLTHEFRRRHRHAGAGARIQAELDVFQAEPQGKGRLKILIDHALPVALVNWRIERRAGDPPGRPA